MIVLDTPGFLALLLDEAEAGTEALGQ